MTLGLFSCHRQGQDRAGEGLRFSEAEYLSRLRILHEQKGDHIDCEVGNVLRSVPEGLMYETRITTHPAMKGCRPGCEGYLGGRGILSRGDGKISWSMKLDEIPAVEHGPVAFSIRYDYKVWAGGPEGGVALFSGSKESEPIQVQVP
jgi:hypothetical protein